MKSLVYWCCLCGLAWCSYSCDNGPKEIVATEVQHPTEGTGIFTPGSRPPLVTEDGPTRVVPNEVHTVEVIDVLPTSKYIYLSVKENDKIFWIATTKQEVQAGELYYYRGGLLKTNFYSQEYDRTFDQIYLVSKIVAANHGQVTAEQAIKIETHGKDNNTYTPAPRDIQREGSVRIAEIINSPTQYEGQTIQISGECVKVNRNIMGRHWLHLKDGSKDDYDLVITSEQAVPEGHIVTIQATVGLNKDFGAGYRYDIILENGVVLQ